MGFLDPKTWWRLTQVLIAVVGCLILMLPDNGHTPTEKLIEKIDRWFMQACTVYFLYYFLYPFTGSTIEPNYANFYKWYIAGILGAALFHFPSFEPIIEDLRMYFFLFMTIFVFSILFFTIFHIIYLVLRWCIGFVSPAAGTILKLGTTIQTCAVLSIACCVFYSHCGNRAILKPRLFEGECSDGFSVWKKGEISTLISKLVWMNEFVDEICSCWFAPVGSAHDYPFWTKWLMFGQGAGSSDKISPLFSLWATFVGLYITNYVVGRSTEWALREEQEKPEFLDMVPWYSGTSADLLKTLFDLLVSVTVFLGRFDMRTLQAAVNKVEDGVSQDFFYDHFKDKDKDKDGFWFDFMADTGDGGISSYSIARLLAQPSLDVKTSDEEFKLRRGNLLLIGGDLAYPNPSSYTYKNRFFRPFKYALQPPTGYKSQQIPSKKPIWSKFPELENYDGPQAFIIPGNHDWFDGLRTFMKYICYKNWLGGWLMPQKKSYFALQLPKNWWVFGLDLALHHDIDADQFIFFSELVEKVGVEDSVIILTHEPNWLLDWYEDNTGKKVSGKNVSRLIRDYLKERCKLRIAGDLHHYMHHSCVTSNGPGCVQHLLVNGCGGAFLHPTHVFSNFEKYCGATYETKAYPSFEDSKRIAFQNVSKFRKKNLQFDVIGGTIYFVLAFSMFPQCKLNHMLQDDSVSGLLRSFNVTVWAAFKYLLEQSYVSLACALLLLTASILFVPSIRPWKQRVIIGVVHASVHLTAALFLMILMELAVETYTGPILSPTSGCDRSYEWTFGLYSACTEFIKSAFDCLEVMAVSRKNICQRGMESMSHGSAAIYYASVLHYFWVISNPVVSLVFGSYLYVCVKWLHLHYDEAFSSLRIADYKGFTRFHINKKGDLEVYTLVVDKVPETWKLDPQWKNEEDNQPERSSHLKDFPSKWSSADPSKDPVKTVRIVDKFVIHRNGENQPEAEAEPELEPEPEPEPE
ncbi:hypothetical protein BT93_B2407 [Corymbia citriodora subsp. variegata]|nr:hypothetical protein BT93_B2407 [Corymbia citriodora subsp. variegata]